MRGIAMRRDCIRDHFFRDRGSALGFGPSDFRGIPVDLGMGNTKIEAGDFCRNRRLRGGEAAEEETRGRNRPAQEEEATPHTPTHPILATLFLTPGS